MRKISLLIVCLVLFFNNSKASAQEGTDSMTLSIVPVVKNKSVYFKYTLKNCSQNTIIFNIASVCNCAFFTLLIDDPNGQRISTKTPLTRINYKYMFEKRKNYISLSPGEIYIRKYRTSGFNFKGKKISLLKLELAPGKYTASIIYTLKESKLHIDNIKYPLNKKIWNGKLQSKEVEFIIE